MRKEDRIRQQQNEDAAQQPTKETERPPNERMKGSASPEPSKPPQPRPGALPLPD